jgi:Zn-dependent oligopeptidase
VVTSFLQHCDDKRIRKTLYESYYSRAAKSSTKLLGTTNSEVIKDLLDLRKRQSKFFGFKNFAEMVIEGKSATSLENVIDMFEK